MKVLIIDNYDSFTYNLRQCIGEVLSETSLEFEIDVTKNDELELEDVRLYDKVVISAGSGNPKDRKSFGVCSEVISEFYNKVPILGICLGMQGLALHFGCRIVNAKTLLHGKTSTIKHSGSKLFNDIPQDIEVMRYNSLIVDESTLPSILRVTAYANDTNEIMALSHVEYPVYGLQFHPESFATKNGGQIIRNFLNE